eukprot:Plantae.Rhodophyta-Purpureofilum_apyrenoidigerum.ctg18749.p1 GENE.Plantae.Rhodophyta-Purpureofilum_apyrenoidigerum.ctg18749~~Plantae.Rhodophyta-Purpureofilum_apyrenoidigerum.ctg18749.p1  ORF type:complete len:435 (+),score=77.73 Plantae.Rhodophyta-Purpureofilum_apyrenoidigerum.ctg18749:41-1306(+)
MLAALRTKHALKQAQAPAYRLWRSVGAVASAEMFRASPGPATLWSEDEVMLRDAVRKFAAGEIAPHVARMDHESKLHPSVLPSLFEAGFMACEIEEIYGGANMNFTQTCIVVEELAKVDPAVSVIVDIHNTLNVNAVRRYGTEEQRKKYLPMLASSALSSFCLSEAGSGSDAFALRTSAKKKGDHYVLNGTKLWISNAAEANLFIVFATVDPLLGNKGITAFILNRDMEGLSVGKKEDKLGIRASSTCELLMNDVHVPEADVLGNVGRGYKIAIESLNEGRIGIGAQMIGLAQGVMAVTIPYLKQRTQFGQSLSTFQGLQFQVSQAATELEAARTLVYNAARLKDRGAPFVKEAACAKLYSSQVAERVASRCVEWAGGVGFTKEYPMEKFYRDAKIGQIYEGTTNMHLQTIWKLIEKEYIG